MTSPKAQLDRPLVVVAFDAVTASRAATVIASLTPERAPVPVLEEGEGSALAAALARGGPARALVALIRPSALQGLVRRVGTAASLACVEPGLLLLADLLGEVKELDAPAVRRLKAAFAQVDQEAFIACLSMEALFFRPADTGVQLGSVLTRTHPAPAGDPDPEGYREALTALIAAAGRDRGPFFVVGTRYAVTRTGLGRVVLGRGWSYAEAGFTWSVGFVATLALMVPEASRGPLRVVFRGHGIDEGLAITTFVRGVRMVTTTTGPLRAVEIDVPVTFDPAAQAAEVEIRFAFDTVHVPAEKGWAPDGRPLAFALASFEFYVEGRRQEPPLDPAGFVRLAGETPTVRHAVDASAGTAADPRRPPLALLRRLLDRRPGRVCVVLIEESDIDDRCWGETVRTVAAEVLILATPTSARLLFASAPGEVLQVEGGLDPVLTILARRGIGPDLLFWSSGATAFAFDALWDRLLAEGGRPAVLIRAPDFDHFRWRSRGRHDFMISAVGDLMVFDPVERMAEL